MTMPRAASPAVLRSSQGLHEAESPSGSRARRYALLGLLSTAVLAGPLGLAAASQGASPIPPVTPVAAVDLERYAGFWYEIARVPAWFQSRCARRSVAVYGRRADGGLSVLNQCIKRNGNVEQATGIARVVDPASRARLRVSLVSLLGWRPFWGDYWVIGLDPDYRWAVVGDPQRRYGWILSRTPSLEPATQAGIFELLARNGYERSRFVLTPQSP